MKLTVFGVRCCYYLIRRAALELHICLPLISVIAFVSYDNVLMMMMMQGVHVEEAMYADVCPASG